MDIAFDNQGVYTASDDGRAYRWNLEGVEPELTYFAFNGSVRKLSVSERYLAAACTDGVVRINHKLSGERVREILQIGKEIRDVKISKDESRIWSCTGDGVVSCHQISSGEVLFKKDLSPYWIWSICLFQDEQVLVCGLGDGSIKFLRADTGQVLATLYAFPNNKEILFTAPPDKTFPNGFFYTNNDSLIHVVKVNPLTKTKENLAQNDPTRIGYLDKLNLKNLFVTRIKNYRNYDSLITRYNHNQNPARIQERILMIRNE